MKALRCLTGRKNQRGAVVIIVAIFLLFAGIGFAAFAIDFAYLHVAKNELQNAADAGALAGARALYYADGSQVNVDGGDSKWTSSANEVAYDAATANEAAKDAVEVIFTGDPDNDHDVQRGHWSFGYGGGRGFTPNDSDVAVDIGNYSEIDLDADPNFINAVRVVTRREASPVKTFFAKIFGQESFTVQAEAIAYRGFTASLPPAALDTIIAICAQSIWKDTDGVPGFSPADKLDCNYGRMLNSGGNQNDHNTGGWTNFDQPDEGEDGCDNPGRPDLAGLLDVDCGKNPDTVSLGQGIGLTGGVVDSIFDHPSKANIVDCWKSGFYDKDGDGDAETPVEGDDIDDLPEYPWTLSLPVIDCPDPNPRNCSKVLGGITVNVVWVLEKENDIGTDAPRRMWNAKATPPDFWIWPGNDTSEADGIARWNDFVQTFNLQTVASEPPDNIELATVYDGVDPDTNNDGFRMKALYFLPDCTVNVPAGTTGGHNFGTLAEIPVLVH